MTGLLKITDPFFLLLLPITAAASHRSGYGPVYPIVKQISNDVRLVQFTPEIAVEQVRGASAYAHLHN